MVVGRWIKNSLNLVSSPPNNAKSFWKIFPRLLVGQVLRPNNLRFTRYTQKYTLPCVLMSINSLLCHHFWNLCNMSIWISQERGMTFPSIKKPLKLWLKDHMFPSRHTTSFKRLKNVYTTFPTSFRRFIDVGTRSCVYMFRDYNFLAELDLNQFSFPFLKHCWLWYCSFLKTVV